MRERHNVMVAQQNLADEGVANTGASTHILLEDVAQLLHSLGIHQHLNILRDTEHETQRKRGHDERHDGKSASRKRECHSWLFQG